MPGLSDRCGVCAREFQFSLSRCAFCHKAFCSDCSFRVGGSAFCSKQCGHAFFYGSDEEVEEADTPGFDEEE